MTLTYIAHIREQDKKTQLLTEHLSEASTLAGQFAEKIGLKESGQLLGLLHDLGKASNEFQKYKDAIINCLVFMGFANRNLIFIFIISVYTFF